MMADGAGDEAPERPSPGQPSPGQPSPGQPSPVLAFGQLGRDLVPPVMLEVLARTAGLSPRTGDPDDPVMAVFADWLAPTLLNVLLVRAALAHGSGLQVTVAAGGGITLHTRQALSDAVVAEAMLDGPGMATAWLWDAMIESLAPRVVGGGGVAAGLPFGLIGPPSEGSGARGRARAVGSHGPATAPNLEDVADAP